MITLAFTLLTSAATNPEHLHLATNAIDHPEHSNTQLMLVMLRGLTFPLIYTAYLLLGVNIAL